MSKKIIRKDTGEEISEKMVRVWKKRFDYTDKQIRNLSPKAWAYIGTLERKKEYRIVAEVVHAKNCACKPKKGDRFVLTANGMLLPEESTFPVFCMYALQALFPFFPAINERFAGNLDPSPSGWDMVRCFDVGQECGGLGSVLFRIYCEKAPAHGATPLTQVV